MDGHVVRYQTGLYKNEISASRNAVMIQGSFEFRSEHSVIDFMRYLQRAWRQHAQLKRTDHEPIAEKRFIQGLRGPVLCSIKCLSCKKEQV